MKKRHILIPLFIISAIIQTSQAQRKSLAGEWFISAIAKGAWDSVALPDSGNKWEPIIVPASEWITQEGDSKDKRKRYQEGDGVWVRRFFTIDKKQSKMDALFTWELIRWGFEAWINGEPIGSTYLYCPGQMAIPEKLLKPGENEIIVKIHNWNHFPRSGHKNHPIVPSGAAIYGWGNKKSMIPGKIGIHFFDRIHLDHCIMVPTIEDSTVTAQCFLSNKKKGTFKGFLDVVIKTPEGIIVGEAKRTIKQSFAASDTLQYTVRIKKPELWSPDNPYCYRAFVALSDATQKIIDSTSEQFGMRKFEIKNGTFYLNNKPHPIRGSNSVSEWLWNEEYFNNKDDIFKKFFIDRARGMNVGAFRTHTLPPLHRVANLTDTHGMLLFAEMPLTYNGFLPQFNPDTIALYRANALAMMEAWVKTLSNHPSIIIWVPTNEAPVVKDKSLFSWHHQTIFPAIKAIDPSRPIMFAAEDAPEIQDMHCYSGFWGGAEGEFYTDVKRRIDHSDPECAMVNSEYIEGMWGKRNVRWTGHEEWNEESERVYAMFGMEQTEALRRYGFDGILPYWFAHWGREGKEWKYGYPTAMYAALKSALAPVAISIDLFNRNYRTGDSVLVPIHIMNDRNVSVSASFSVFVLKTHPEFHPGNPVFKKAQPVTQHTLTAGSRATVIKEIRVPLPQKEGIYFLAAVLDKGTDYDAVMSQRQLHVLAANELPKTVRNRHFRIVGADTNALTWFTKKGIRYTKGIPFGQIEDSTDMIIIWENASSGPQSLYLGNWVNQFIHKGGRLLIMRQATWEKRDWGHVPNFMSGEPLTYEVETDRASTAYAVENTKPTLWTGMKKEYMMRWNGYEGMVVQDKLITDFLEGTPPGRISSAGPLPFKNEAIVIEGELPVRSNYVCDGDERFLDFGKKDHPPLALKNVRFSKAGLLYSKNLPKENYFYAIYDFELTDSMESTLWVFEHGRHACSPFKWRIDKGKWHLAGLDIKPQNLLRVHDRSRIWFGWSELGNVSLTPGKHHLEIRVDKPSKNGPFHLAQDCFIFTPKTKGKVLCQSGSSEPVLVSVPMGKGEVIISQFLMADRLNKDSSMYDPAAERFLLNMLGY